MLKIKYERKTIYYIAIYSLVIKHQRYITCSCVGVCIVVHLSRSSYSKRLTDIITFDAHLELKLRNGVETWSTRNAALVTMVWENSEG